VNSGQGTVDRECWNEETKGFFKVCKANFSFASFQIIKMFYKYVTLAYRTRFYILKILINMKISEGNYPSLSTVHCPLSTSKHPYNPKFKETSNINHINIKKSEV